MGHEPAKADEVANRRKTAVNKDFMVTLSEKFYGFLHNNYVRNALAVLNTPK
jgi:hypothetical protein|tara:strand:+ start:235 stop:390 length:156 start_codon:yes stop_codon:yes gene_type:complete